MNTDDGSTQVLAEKWLDACAAYRRDEALTYLDMPVGETRDARLAERIEWGADACSAPELAELHHRMTEAPEGQTDAWRRLWSWGAQMFLRGAQLPHRRGMLDQQRSLTCRVDDELITVGSSFALMAQESRRDRRAAIEVAVTEQLGALAERFESQFEALTAAMATLGYESVDRFWYDITGVDLEAQQEIVTELLQETETVYVELLEWAARQQLRLPISQLRRHDMLVLFGMPEYQKYYQPDFLVPSLQACLQDMDIDPRADGRLTWRERPAAFGPVTALVLELPEEIVLSYAPGSGLQYAQAFAHACGRGLLQAYTHEDMPPLYRVLGDDALVEANAQWLTEVVGHPMWLRWYARLGVDRDYMTWQRLDRLYRFRRQLGRFLYTRHLYTTDSRSGAAEAYREIMMDACRIDYAPNYAWVDWDWSYSSLTFYRGWSLAYALLEALHENFAHDWFRNPESGEWLRQYWAEALSHAVDDVLSSFLGGPWTVAHLAESLCDERVG